MKKFFNVIIFFAVLLLIISNSVFAVGIDMDLNNTSGNETVENSILDNTTENVTENTAVNDTTSTQKVSTTRNK